MGDEDHRRVDRAQELLEPFERLDVEVVRRLVEEQQVGLRCEGAGQRGARELAAGERRDRAVRGRPSRSRGSGSRRRRGRASRSRLRARAAPGPRSTARASSGRGRRPPSPPRARAAPARPPPGPRCPPARSRRSGRLLDAGGRWSWSVTLAPFSKARSPPSSEISPASARRSVVLPAPFTPARASRSRRSTLNGHCVEERSSAKSFLRR